MVPLPNDVSPIVEVESESWFVDLTEALNTSGSARLRATRGKKGLLAEALRCLAIAPIDTGGLHVFARLVGYARCGEGMALVLEMPEALQ
jgi:hypothetical protein